MGSDAVGMTAVIEEVVRDRIGLREREEGTVRQVSDQHRRNLVASWEALDAWVGSQMRKRKGVHIPALMKLTWQFSSTEDGRIKQRPVFVLTEAFCRSIRFKGKKPTLPPSTSKCEDINFHRLALNFSESITKDVAFLSIRDLVRKLGDKVCQGNTVHVQFQVGTFQAKRRSVRFDFDQRAMRPTDAGDMGEPPVSTRASTPAAAAAAAAPTTPARTAEDTMTATGPLVNLEDSGEDRSSDAAASPTVPPLWSGEGSPVPGLGGVGEGTTGAATTAPQQPPLARPEDSRITSFVQAFQRSPARAIGLEPECATVLSQYNHLNDSMSAGTEDNPALQQAYIRHIAELEREAVFDELEAETIAERRQALEQALDHKENTHRRELKELQSFIKSQIKLRQDERANEIKDRRTLKEPQPQPYLRKPEDKTLLEEGELDEYGGVVYKRKPMDLKDPTVRLGLLQRHGKARVVHPHLGKKQLLTSLQRQMQVKYDRARAAKDAEKEEEKRYLDHVLMEMDMHAKHVKAGKLAQERDLLAAWERDGHLKNLRKLKTLGAAPVREYATTALLTAPSGSVGGQSSASRLGSAGVGVGYDPRSSARSARSS